MIGYLSGKIIKKNADKVLLNIGGVGYQIQITTNTFYALPDVGEEYEFFIHTHVREDQLTLYGFPREIEKAVFLSLIGVSGIGPKLALSVLSSLETDEILKAIVQGNSGILNTIPGVGKKTSERIVLELKDKITKTFPEELDRVKKGKKVEATFRDDLISALLNLGYKKNVAEVAASRLDETKHPTLETALKESLKYLSSNL